jgi:hypothetical protein
VSVAEPLIQGTASPIVLFPPSAGLAGEVRVGSDFKARAAVFLRMDADRLFLIRKSILGDFRKIWAQSPFGLCYAYLDLIS